MVQGMINHQPTNFLLYKMIQEKEGAKSEVNVIFHFAH